MIGLKLTKVDDVNHESGIVPDSFFLILLEVPHFKVARIEKLEFTMPKKFSFVALSR